jgi:hypothetical protein
MMFSVSPSIFLRHYWSPSFKELRDRTLEATKQLKLTEETKNKIFQNL